MNTLRSIALSWRALFLSALIGEVATAQARAPSVETRVDTMIARQVRSRHIPGLSLGVVRDGHLIYAKGYGEANIAWKAPATPETVYLLASMTKQFTATAVMILVSEGRVRLDDTIGAYVAAPPAWKDITIRQLLTHTAGLKDRFESAPDARLYLDYTAQQMLDAATHTAPDFLPGAQWQYSDQGFFLLGMVVERASGRSYAQFLRERIFNPVGMTSSSIHKLVYHGGSTGTCLFRLPDDGVSVIVLTNLEQAAGSDPCFIARGVATLYVPAVSIVGIPVIGDRDSARTSRLRAAVEAFAGNALDSADYTPAAFKVIRDAAQAQYAGFAQLGPVLSFELVADDSLAGHVVYCRAHFRDAVLNFRYVLDERGRIASLQAR